MENPEAYSTAASPGRESLGEGSADLEKLLQTAEAENLQMVKLIDTERQRSTEFQKQIEETITKTEQLEESTKKLDVEAKQLHSKFKQNREISEGLKKTAIVLDEHEEALRKKLEMVTLEQQTQQLQQQGVVEKYENIWAGYAKKYENIPMAKELKKIKQTATMTETSVREVSEQISKIQSKIIEMEVEKTHMQEYLQGNQETATESIIKIAGLFLGAEASSAKAREKLQELNEKKKKLDSATEGRMEMTENENESNAVVHSNEALQGMEEPAEANESQAVTTATITSTESSDDHHMINTRQRDTPVEVVTSSNAPVQDTRMPGQLPIIQVPQGHQRTPRGQQNCRDVAREANVARTSTVPQVPRPHTPSNQQEENISNSRMEQTEESTQVIPVSITHAPNTPVTTGHVTQVSQSAAGTPVSQPVTRSPLDFNNHFQYTRQVTQSPGEGFVYTGRSMYNNDNNQTNQQQEQVCVTQETGQTYEAPLNDRRDISPNFFQPFQQQQQDRNLFQANSEESPSHSRSIFMRPSPSGSGSTSPNAEHRTSLFSSSSPQDVPSSEAQFSFGNSSSNPSNDFLSSNSPRVNMFGQNKEQENNESFAGGFSLFGSSSSPNQSNEDNSNGFSFNFGSKSPSTSNNSSSGFFLF